MKILICQKCCIIDEILSNEINKYDLVSEENLALHKSLIKLKHRFEEYVTDLMNLRDSLAAERECNLELSLQNELLKQSIHPVVNSTFNGVKEITAYKKDVKPCSILTENDLLPVLSYEKLHSYIMEQQKKHEEDLELFRTIHDKCYTGLFQQLKEAEVHSSIALDMYDVMRKNLFQEKKENVKLHNSFKEQLLCINQEMEKQIYNARNEIIREATKTASNNINELKYQLSERDKLISKLLKQQSNFQTLISNKESNYRTELKKNEELRKNLMEKLSLMRRQYTDLKRRRELDIQGFFSDLKINQYELKRLKRDMQRVKNNGQLEIDINIFDKKVDSLHRKLNLIKIQPISHKE